MSSVCLILVPVTPPTCRERHNSKSQGLYYVAGLLIGKTGKAAFCCVPLQPCWDGLKKTKGEKEQGMGGEEPTVFPVLEIMLLMVEYC